MSYANALSWLQMFVLRVPSAGRQVKVFILKILCLNDAIPSNCHVFLAFYSYSNNGYAQLQEAFSIIQTSSLL